MMVRKKIGSDNQRSSLMICLTCLLLLAFAVISSGCVTEVIGSNSSFRKSQLKLYSDQEVQQFRPMLTRYNLDPALNSDYSIQDEEEEDDLFKPFRKHGRMIYLGDDGCITKHYYLEAGNGKRIAALLAAHTDLIKVGDSIADLKQNQVTVFPNFVIDEKRTVGIGNTAFAKYGSDGKGKVVTRNALDLLVVKAMSEKLYDVEQYMAKVLTEIPQIEIKVRVIEVALQDKFEYGSDTIVYRDTGSDKSFLHTLFDSSGNYESGGWTTKFNTESLQISGPDNFQGTIFHVSGVHDKFAMDSLIEMVQRTSDSQILSAPKITVLDKHKAVIDTGVNVPVMSVQTAQSSTTYKYIYHPTGVKIVILPSLLMDNTLQVEISAEVNTISGYESVDISEGSVSVPTFASRNFHTIIRVKEGEALALGGLMTRSEIEQVSKIPLIGDIPILGYFFKSKKKDFKKTEIIFYVEPRIIRPQDSLYIPE